MRRIWLLSAAVLLRAVTARAGGPEYVAGASCFDPTTKGMPLTWVQGAINYYTDQGDLSPILLGPSADSFVATRFGGARRAAGGRCQR